MKPCHVLCGKIDKSNRKLFLHNVSIVSDMSVAFPVAVMSMSGLLTFCCNCN